MSDADRSTQASATTAAPAPYQVVSPEQRDVWTTKGKRAIAFGVIWFVAGLLFTVVTYAQAQGGGVYFVAWGPMLYGVYRVVCGIRFLNKRGS